MVTAIEFIVGDGLRGFHKNFPDAEPGDRMLIIGKPTDGASFSTGTCDELSGWSAGDYAGHAFITFPPKTASKGPNAGVLFLRPGDTVERGDTLINVTEQVGTTCYQDILGTTVDFQLYTADKE